MGEKRVVYSRQELLLYGGRRRGREARRCGGRTMRRWRWWLCEHSGQGYYRDLPGGYLNTDNTYSTPTHYMVVLFVAFALHEVLLVTTFRLTGLFRVAEKLQNEEIIKNHVLFV